MKIGLIGEGRCALDVKGQLCLAGYEVVGYEPREVESLLHSAPSGDALLAIKPPYRLYDAMEALLSEAKEIIFLYLPAKRLHEGSLDTRLIDDMLYNLNGHLRDMGETRVLVILSDLGEETVKGFAKAYINLKVRIIELG